MAIQSLCAKIFNGLDVGCAKPVSKYYQQAVIINKSDIDNYTITLPDVEGEICDYNVTFNLKPGTTGYRIIGAEAGSSFFGSVSKTRNDLGYAQYIHNVSILVAGISEEIKCILDGLDKGSFVVALQAKDGTVEIYGMVYGLTTGDYEYNIQEGGGGTAIVLSSLEDAQESNLPLVYVSSSPGQEGDDFDNAFAAGS
jgi:hypothetical protein